MKNFITLEQVTDDLYKFMTSFTKTSFDHMDFHAKVRRSFADCENMEESDLTISDGVRIPIELASSVKTQIFLRLKLLYGFGPDIVSAFDKYNSKKLSQIKSQRR
ncbi:hypothetical protein [Paenibacillus sp. IITD108]|uniref:hypothetical protein n=1 Tax=Paenibacillus sp. IITD108 TaxID=3116649 RepID=UPI002F428B87